MPMMSASFRIYRGRKLVAMGDNILFYSLPRRDNQSWTGWIYQILLAAECEIENVTGIKDDWAHSFQVFNIRIVRN